MAQWLERPLCSRLTSSSFPKSIHAKRLKKMVFTASMLGVQHKRVSVEIKPASLLVVSFGKALNGMPPSLPG